MSGYSQGFKKVIHQFFHQLALISHVQCWPVDAVNPKSAQVSFLIRVVDFFYLPACVSLFSLGAFLLATAITLMFYSPEELQEPKIAG